MFAPILLPDAAQVCNRNLTAMQQRIPNYSGAPLKWAQLGPSLCVNNMEVPSFRHTSSGRVNMYSGWAGEHNETAFLDHSITVRVSMMSYMLMPGLPNYVHNFTKACR